MSQNIGGSKLVCRLDYRALLSLIGNAKQKIYLVLPGVFDEIAEALVKRKKDGVGSVKVITNVSEGNIRNGFGTISAIEILRSAGVEVYECSDNLVSFIICDDSGYWLFPQSRIFRFEQAGTNAASMDPVTQLRLIHHYFPVSASTIESESKASLDSAMKALKVVNAEVEQELATPASLDQAIYLLDEKDLAETKSKLEKNPPLHPDLQRQINTYVAKIQFADLSFEGSNVQSTKVSLPPDALPIKSGKLKKLLETRMRLFENLEEEEGFSDFAALKGDIEKIRKNYLISITSRKKSILRVEDKQAFTREVEAAQSKAKEVNKRLPELLMSLILDSKDRIRSEIEQFLSSNPPEELKSIEGKAVRERTLYDMASRIVSRIKYPEPSQLLNKAVIKMYFYDVTFEDFRNEEFLQELEEKEVMASDDISSIVRISQAFSTKPSNAEAAQQK